MTAQSLMVGGTNFSNGIINYATEGSSSAEELAHAEWREDTAIQRQVADLKAAGLNPILATNYGGASSAAAVKYVDSPSQKMNAKTNRLNSVTNFMNAISNFIGAAAKLG